MSCGQDMTYYEQIQDIMQHKAGELNPLAKTPPSGVLHPGLAHATANRFL